MTTQLDNLAINTIRTLSIDMINKANSGHPGLPMGAAPMAYSLWSNHLNHNPLNSKWFNRDRFILSAGHGSALLYSLLHLFGYKVSLEDLKNFRQIGSKTPGHPEFGHTDGVEATTGPLGQGIANAVGMAMAEKFLSERYNKEQYNVVDHHTYALVGDGCLMEGVSYEAISLAGHLGLGKLIVLHDSNDISLDGALNLSFSEDIQQRFESAKWQYIRVEDGNDVEAISKAIEEAKQNATQPTLIEIKTVIGYGSSNEGTNKVHGAPLGTEDTAKVKAVYDWNYEKEFFVPQEVKELMNSLKDKGASREEKWNDLFDAYKKAHPELAEQLSIAIEGKTEEEVFETLPEFEVGKTMSTRIASQEAINYFADKLPNLFGGSADLAHSNMTDIKMEKKFVVEATTGRNIHFGVREHAMGAALNGMALHGGVQVFGGTFFVFNDYLRPSIRLAALQGLPVTYVFTHDSVAVGEDGPTHEPIEQLVALRSIPNLTVIRPADVHETFSAWKYALKDAREPVALVLSRQNLPNLESTKANYEGLVKGAYIAADSEGKPDVILIATGSEVSLALESKAKLEQDGVKVRVVSMPSWELFEQQTQEYKEEVLPSDVTNRLSLEMGISLGWERYVGTKGKMLSIDTFGASGKGDEVIQHFGFTVENVVVQVKEMM
ncbi:transketolase [Priestia filamentosa]|uniref:transketolase n=1 Tax=Priestia filamentosa TaxID=1402861 RepID=UPI00397AB9BD